MKNPGSGAIDGKLPSDRRFGLTFGGIAALAAGWFVRAERPLLGSAFAAASVGFLVASWLRPRLLRPLNVGWFRLGVLLGRFVSPIVLGVLFFLVLTPIAIAFRLAGRDALRLRLHPEAKTYWIDRDPPGPDGPSFKNQF